LGIECPLIDPVAADIKLRVAGVKCDVGGDFKGALCGYIKNSPCPLFIKKRGLVSAALFQGDVPCTVNIAQIILSGTLNAYVPPSLTLPTEGEGINSCPRRLDKCAVAIFVSICQEDYIARLDINISVDINIVIGDNADHRCLQKGRAGKDDITQTCDLNAL